MNRIARVEDISRDEVLGRRYDLVCFASGHEARAGHLAGLLDPALFSRAIVFGFQTHVKEGARSTNDQIYRDRWGVEPVVIPGRGEDDIYGLLSAELKDVRRARVAVDYSSMTRFWYAAILNWFRFCDTVDVIEVDFLYCGGEYQADIPSLEITDILSIPGCEGNTASAGPSVALLGLGFDSNSVQCVLDDFEPDIVKSFIAGGSARADYVKKVMVANQELFERYGPPLELPLESVSTTLTCLTEVVAPYEGSWNVSIVPLGPKPHVLAGILLAMQRPQVAALHIAGDRSPPWDARATSLLVGTRVDLRTDVCVQET